MVSALDRAGVDRTNDPQVYDGKPELVVVMEDIVTINDLLSTCKWMGGWARALLSQERQAALFTAGSGIETSAKDLFSYARKVRTMERAYEVGEGMTSEKDVLPERFLDHPIGQGPWKGATLDSEAFHEMKRQYYLLRGWDPQTGIPTQETLKSMGLDEVASDLQAMGKGY
jgi:aldehyde:ferredoxin oxidoreductase